MDTVERYVPTDKVAMNVFYPMNGNYIAWYATLMIPSIII